MREPKEMKYIKVKKKENVKKEGTKGKKKKGLICCLECLSFCMCARVYVCLVCVCVCVCI